MGELGNAPIESVLGDLGGVDPKAAKDHQRELERTGQVDSQPSQEAERDAGDDDQGWDEPAPNPVDEALGDARSTDEQAAALEEGAANMEAAGDHDKAELRHYHVIRKNAVSADNDIDIAFFRTFDHGFLLFWRTETRK